MRASSLGSELRSPLASNAYSSRVIRSSWSTSPTKATRPKTATWLLTMKRSTSSRSTSKTWNSCTSRGRKTTKLTRSSREPHEDSLKSLASKKRLSKASIKQPQEAPPPSTDEQLPPPLDIGALDCGPPSGAQMMMTMVH